MAGEGVDLGSVHTSIRLQIQDLVSGISQAKAHVRQMDLDLQRATSDIQRQFQVMSGSIERALTSAFSRAGATTQRFQKMGDELQQSTVRAAQSVQRMDRDLQQSARNVEQNFDSMGRTIERVLLAAFSVAAVRGFAREMDELAQRAFRAQSGLLIFANQLRRTNQDLDDAMQRVRALSAQLRVPQEEIAGAAAELLRYGYSMEQITTVFTGAAASALLVGKSTSDGIRLVTDALISERSVLLNEIGIVENLSNAYVRYARELGVSSDALTAQQRAEASTQMIMRATAAEVADLETLFRGYGGAVAESEMESYRWRVTLGNAVLPAATDVREEMTELYRVLAQIAQTPEARETIETIGDAMAATVREIREAVEWLGRHQELLKEMAEIAIPGMATALAVSLLPRIRDLYNILRAIGRLPATKAGLIMVGLFSLLQALDAVNARMERGQSITEATLDALRDAGATLRALVLGEELPAPEEPELPQPSGAFPVVAPGAEEQIRKLSDAMGEYEARIALAEAGQGDLNAALREYRDYLRQIVEGQHADYTSLEDRAEAARTYVSVLKQMETQTFDLLELRAELAGELDQEMVAIARWEAEAIRLAGDNQELIAQIREEAERRRAEASTKAAEQEAAEVAAVWREQIAAIRALATSGWEGQFDAAAQTVAVTEAWMQRLRELGLRETEAFRELELEYDKANLRIIGLLDQRAEAEKRAADEAAKHRAQLEGQITEDINRVRMTETDFFAWQLSLQVEMFRAAGIEEARIMAWTAAMWEEFWQQKAESAQDALEQVEKEVATLADLIRGSISAELGQTGELIAGIAQGAATGNWTQAGAAAFDALISESEALAEAFAALADGVAALLEPIDALLGVIEGTFGETGRNVAVGAAAGAAIGSVIPGIGTVVGAIVGAALGWIGSLGKSQEEVQRESEQRMREVASALREAANEFRSSLRESPLYKLFERPEPGVPDALRQQREDIEARIEAIRRWGVWPWEKEELAQLQEDLRAINEEEVQYLQDAIEEVDRAIRERLSVTTDDIMQSVRGAFSADSAAEFSDMLGDSLHAKVRDAIVTAFLESAAMTPIWTALSDAIVGAVQDGVLTAAELATLEQIMQEIEDKALPFYEALEELGLVGGGEGGGDTATGGTRLTELTGRSRDLFAEMLRPLGNLDRLTWYGDGILTELRQQTAYLSVLSEQGQMIAAAERITLESGQVIMEYVASVTFTGPISQVNIAGGQAGQSLEAELQTLQDRGALQSRAAGA